MHNKIIALCICLLLGTPVVAQADCFIAQENAEVIATEGDCSSRHAPRCSFNIAISLMAYNEDVLQDQYNPEYPFKKGYLDYADSWKQSHNPAQWIKNSCVWYSQLITQKLGMQKFQDYVNSFNYGNHDVSGDPGKNNGLTRSWMSGSSLQISPTEQVKFLNKLIDRQLKLKPRSYEMTSAIIYIEDLADGAKLYGKTGTGNTPNADGTLNQDREEGWFVGWLEIDQRKIVFAQYLEQAKQEIPAGGAAKQLAKQKLLALLKQ